MNIKNGLLTTTKKRQYYLLGKIQLFDIYSFTVN